MHFFICLYQLLDFHSFVSDFFLHLSIFLFPSSHRVYCTMCTMLTSLHLVLSLFFVCFAKLPNRHQWYLFVIFYSQNESTDFRIPKNNSGWHLITLFSFSCVFCLPRSFIAMQKIKKLEIIWRQTNLMTDYGHWLFALVCACVYSNGQAGASARKEKLLHSHINVGAWNFGETHRTTSCLRDKWLLINQ